MQVLTHRDGYAGEEEIQLVPPLPPRLSILLLLLSDLRYRQCCPLRMQKLRYTLGYPPSIQWRSPLCISQEKKINIWSKTAPSQRDTVRSVAKRRHGQNLSLNSAFLPMNCLNNLWIINEKAFCAVGISSTLYRQIVCYLSVD
jgi:hypothetical protein